MFTRKAVITMSGVGMCRNSYTNHNPNSDQIQNSLFTCRHSDVSAERHDCSWAGGRIFFCNSYKQTLKTNTTYTTLFLPSSRRTSQLAVCLYWMGGGSQSTSINVSSKNSKSHNKQQQRHDDLQQTHTHKTTSEKKT